MKNSCIVIVVSVICNIFLCVLKTIIGILSHSQAMIADGLHSLEDVSTSIISLIGNKIASKENKIYLFGIKRVKYVFSLTVSILMIIVSITMLKNIFSSIFERSQYIFSIYSLIVCLITIITKLILYIYSKNEYIKTNNILIKSIMYDHRNDIIITIGVIASLISGKYNLYKLDYIISIIISLIIAYSGIKIFLESYNILVCKKVENNIVKEKFNYPLDLLNIGENYIAIVYIKKYENVNINELYNKDLLEKYNISQLLIRYV